MSNCHVLISSQYYVWGCIWELSSLIEFILQLRFLYGLPPPHSTMKETYLDEYAQIEIGDYLGLFKLLISKVTIGKSGDSTSNKLVMKKYYREILK